MAACLQKRSSQGSTGRPSNPIQPSAVNDPSGSSAGKPSRDTNSSEASTGKLPRNTNSFGASASKPSS